MPTGATWLTAFLDLPADGFDEAVAFWRGVTGYGVSAPRGEHGEFATLVPPVGDAHLRVQRVADRPPGVHVDVHHPDHGFRVRSSPGGLPYCEVSEPLSAAAPPATWPGGHRSVVDQVCLDIPPSRYEEECAFWAGRTGWALSDDTGGHREFRRLVPPAGQALRVLLQRLDDEQPRTTAHLDLATDDRAAETRRHTDLGATVVREGEAWTVLSDPVGTTYCITRRTPR